ncbi:hypothetical protein [Planctomyces sp. SH-PL14]|uniref:hypothetical protein n=1 Tax=Planctomyces sp. SH-PL14 TaxID=1632864 RepID=UPI00078D7303|nr:hypothetical protein [Planctomyces sp. SH-PL14]AMV22327.1 hypothetical protein VT03_30785 [Planctomyces sp. SH-PL14]
MSEQAPAGSIESGKAHVTFVAVDGKLDKSLTTMQNRLKAFGSFATKAGALLSAAGAGAATGMLALSKSYADAGSAIDDMSQRTGVAVKFISELRYAAQMSGTSIEACEKAIVAMSRSLYSADEESKGAVESLRNLGLSVGDLKGKSPDQALLAIAEALSRVEDPSRRTALAMKVFGKSGTELIPMLSGGRKGIEELVKSAEELGITMTTEDAQAAAALGDALDELQMAIGGVKNAIGAAVAGELTDWINWFKEGIPQATAWLKTHEDSVTTFGKISAGAAVAGSALTAFGIAATGVSLGFTQVVSAAGGVMKAMKGIGAIASGGGGLLAIAAIATAIGAAIARWASQTEEYNKQLAISKRLNSELEDVDRKRTQKSLDDNRAKTNLGDRRKDIAEKIRMAEVELQGSVDGVTNAENNLKESNTWGNWALDNRAGSSELDSLRQDIKDAEARRDANRENLQALRDEETRIKDEQAATEPKKASSLDVAKRLGFKAFKNASSWGRNMSTKAVGLAEATKPFVERSVADFDQMTSEADQIRESNETPAEKRAKRLKRVDDLRTGGVLSDRDAAMERAKIGLEAAQEKTAQLEGRVQKRESLNLGISDDQKSLLAAQAGKMNAEDQTAKNTADSARTLDELLIATKNLNQYLTQNGVALVETDG